jgi:hypothetical protein
MVLTGYAICDYKYGAPITARSGADCTGKAAGLNRAAKGCSCRQLWSGCARCRRVTYTSSDSRRRVVVWSVVVPTSVPNCVAVAVGAQSPIFLLAAAACRVGTIKSKTKRSWSGTRAYYRSYVTDHLLACRPFFSAQKLGRRAPPLPSCRLAPRRMCVCDHAQTPRISRPVLHITSHESSFSAGRSWTPNAPLASSLKVNRREIYRRHIYSKQG